MGCSTKGVVFVLLLASLLFLIGCSEEDGSITGATVAEQSTLTVTTFSENGSLLDGVRVYVNEEFRGETREFGRSKGTRMTLLRRKTNTVRVDKEGYYAPGPTIVGTGGDKEVSFVLEKRKTNYVVVVEDDDEKGVEGARVSLSSVDGQGVLEEETDEYGTAMFKKVDDGNYSLSISKAGHEIVEMNVSIVHSRRGDFSSSNIELKLAPRLTIEVVDNEEIPMVEAEVTLFTKKDYNSPGGLPLSRWYTDELGKINFDEVEYDESYIIVVKNEDYLAKVVEHRLRNNEPLEIEMVWNIE